MSVSSSNSSKNIKKVLVLFALIPQIVIQTLSLFVLAILSITGLIKLFLAFCHLSDIYHFLKDILHSLEILFIAPIPVLIIFSFRKHISSVFSNQSNSNGFTLLDKAMDAIEAKKAFVTSIIGITSTYILGLFIEIFSITQRSNNNETLPSLNTDLHISNDFIIILIIAIVFLIIQILLYKLLSAHNSTQEQIPPSNSQNTA